MDKEKALEELSMRGYNAEIKDNVIVIKEEGMTFYKAHKLIRNVGYDGEYRLGK